MKRSGPLLTLLAGLLLGLFMLSLNATTGTRSASTSYREEAPTATASPSAAPSPSPSASKTPAQPPPVKSPVRSPVKSPVVDADYAGRTDDGSSAVSVSVRDGRAIAYFCDGHDTESWLRGAVREDGRMRLTDGHGAALTGTLQGGRRLRGSVDIDGGHHAFTADRAKKPSGLYRATATVRGAKVDGGWIVLADGTQVGVLTRGGKPSPAPRIDPATGVVTVDGRKLTAHPVTP
ncbi:hypothetical protein ABZT03_17070 [Streptomyces sp. NPDC005574]|uniref:hypothetical protein n=1 Tax=Streptomyces sp. NPDC005574 TaxID=3156891 RepID=UPI0033A62696